MKVLFLKHPFAGGDFDLFAYFPHEIADNQGNYLSYAHIGQHSACSPLYAAESIEARPHEYAELLGELSGIYGKLDILNGRKYKKRIEQLKNPY